MWFLLVLMTDFMPSERVARGCYYINKAVGCFTCGMVVSRIGRWHTERAMIHGVIRAKMEERGPRGLTLLSGIDAADAVHLEDDEWGDDWKSEEGDGNRADK